MWIQGTIKIGTGRGQDRTNPFAATRVTSRRCGFLPYYFGDLLSSVICVDTGINLKHGSICEINR